jgi:hypothetical protein
VLLNAKRPVYCKSLRDLPLRVLFHVGYAQKLRAAGHIFRITVRQFVIFCCRTLLTVNIEPPDSTDLIAKTLEEQPCTETA